MSDPIDIKALDEYLKGGSDISQRYREFGREDVPPELDRRVLDEARAAVADGGTARSRSWLRWSAPVALAASVVLVVTVLLERGVQDETAFELQTVEDAPRSDDVRQAEEYKLLEQAARARQEESQAQFVPEQPAAVAPAAPPAAPPPTQLPKAEAQRSKSIASEEVRVQAQAVRDQSTTTSAVAVEPVTDESERLLANQQPAPSLARTETISSRKEVDRGAGVADSSADSASVVQEIAVTGSRVRRTPGRTAGPRNTISNSAFNSERRPTADADAAAEQADPVKWLEQIRDLRRAGKAAEADRAWQSFREAFPDFPVADDDIARQRP